MQRGHPNAAGGKENAIVIIEVSLGRDPELTKIVQILGDSRFFLDAAENRQRNSDQDRDDRDNDEQFDQSEGA